MTVHCTGARAGRRGASRAYTLAGRLTRTAGYVLLAAVADVAGVVLALICRPDR